jgi:uncharacterized membrane protein
MPKKDKRFKNVQNSSTTSQIDESQILGARLTEETVSVFSGPLPAPEILAGYGKIDPAFPKMIIEMAQNEQKARHKALEEDSNLRRTIVDLNYKSTKLGTITQGVIIFVVLIAAIILANMGQSGKSIAAIIGGIAALMGSSVFKVLKERKTTLPTTHKNKENEE